MPSERFYAELPIVADVDALTAPENFARMPGDWHVAMCDVRDSYAAIAAGSYKKVNTLGAAAITAVLNAARGLDIPFVFGGDGSTLCVPPRLLAATRAALLQTRDFARSSFGWRATGCPPITCRPCSPAAVSRMPSAC